MRLLRDTSADPLYRATPDLRLASRLSLKARQHIFDLFWATLRPGPSDRVLDLGVTNDTSLPESNFFEQVYPYRTQLTCAGIEDGAALEMRYPGVRFVRVTPDQPLPFSTGEFDIVVSDAVIEHLGGHEQRRRFVREVERVGRRYWLVIPNRWFPVEPHIGVPVLHWLPHRWFRAILQPTRLNYWATEAHLSLLGAKDLAGLFPEGSGVRILRAGIGVGPCRSNLVATGPGQSTGGGELTGPQTGDPS